MEYKQQIFEAKAIPDGKNLYIEGWAAVYGNLDTYNDVIVPGAFKKTITGAGATRIKLCAQHRQKDIVDVIGKVIELRDEAKGLWFRAKVSNTSKGRDAAELVMDEAIDEVSIGYVTVDFEMVKDVRYLKEIDLREISLVIRAANIDARIENTEVKEDKPIEKPKPISEMTDEELIRMRRELEKEIGNRVNKQFLKSI